MKKTKIISLIAISLMTFLFCTTLRAQDSITTAIPQWLLDDWATRTADSGIWITDNSKYQNEQEPFEAYGQEMKFGLGQKHLKSRLYCIRDGKDVGTVWEIIEYWDPESQHVRVLQIGSDGTIAHGKIWRLEDGRVKEQARFTSPQGNSFDSGHLIWMENKALHTKSFNIVDGEWESNRYYIWEATPNN